jgi:hypothetical protein
LSFCWFRDQEFQRIETLKLSDLQNEKPSKKEEKLEEVAEKTKRAGSRTKSPKSKQIRKGSTKVKKMAPLMAKSFADLGKRCKLRK